MADVIPGSGPSFVEADGQEQGDYPYSENGFDLTKEVKRLGPKTDFLAVFTFHAGAVPALEPVSQPEEHRGKERMNDGTKKEEGRQEVERIDTNAGYQDVDQRSIRGFSIGAEGMREIGVLERRRNLLVPSTRKKRKAGSTTSHSEIACPCFLRRCHKMFRDAS